MTEENSRRCQKDTFVCVHKQVEGKETHYEVCGHRQIPLHAMREEAVRRMKMPGKCEGQGGWEMQFSP